MTWRLRLPSKTETRRVKKGDDDCLINMISGLRYGIGTWSMEAKTVGYNVAVDEGSRVNWEMDAGGGRLSLPFLLVLAGKRKKEETFAAAPLLVDVRCHASFGLENAW